MGVAVENDGGAGGFELGDRWILREKHEVAAFSAQTAALRSIRVNVDDWRCQTTGGTRLGDGLHRPDESSAVVPMPMR